MKHLATILLIVLAAALSCSPDKPDYNNPVDPDGTAFKGFTTPTLSTNALSGAPPNAEYSVYWNDVATTAYIIEEAESDSFSGAASHAISGTSKSFSHPTEGKTYYYRVKTNTGNKDSGWSSMISVEIKIGVKIFPISGISFVSITGGTFQMGDVENSGESDEKPVHSVTVSGFEMGKYAVTNAQYCAYLNAALASGDITATSTSVTGARGSYSGQEYIELSGGYNANNNCWITFSGNTFSVASGKGNWPVVYVSWYGSKAFALYYGLDLPTEAEWEYACRGGRQYKYGTDDGTISSAKANYNSNVGYPKDVGSYPASPYGLYDMSGNVWEWCHDWYGEYSSGSQNNPSGAQTGSTRVERGGSWNFNDYGCRSANRSGIDPGRRYFYVGFRVVRRLSPQNY